MDIVIKNGTVINSGDSFKADIGIRNGKIVALGDDLSGMENIDATGKYILPGLIEVHSYLESPFGNTRSIDNFYRGSQAAACGGVTTIIDRVVPTLDESLSEAIENRRELADAQVAIDYSLHVCMTRVEDSLLEEIPALVSQGYPSFEAYMSCREAECSLSEADMLLLMQALGETNSMLLLHCGSQALLDHLRAQYPIPEQGEAIPRYPDLFPPEAEATGVLQAISLARHFETPIYLHNLSSWDAIQILSQYHHLVPRVHAGCSLHHLTHTRNSYQLPDGRNYTCTPPLRRDSDTQALWGGLVSGLLQVVGSTHRAFTREQKKLGSDLASIPEGFANLGALLPVLFQKGVVGKRLSLIQLVGLLSTWPAQIFGLSNKGSVSIGKDADLVIFDPMERSQLTAATLHTESDFCLYEGLEVAGRVEMTLSRGKIVAENGRFVGEQGAGQFIPRRL